MLEVYALERVQEAKGLDDVYAFGREVTIISRHLTRVLRLNRVSAITQALQKLVIQKTSMEVPCVMSENSWAQKRNQALGKLNLEAFSGQLALGVLELLQAPPANNQDTLLACDMGIVFVDEVVLRASLNANLQRVSQSIHEKQAAARSARKLARNLKRSLARSQAVTEMVLKNVSSKLRGLQQSLFDSHKQLLVTPSPNGQLLEEQSTMNLRDAGGAVKDARQAREQA